MSNSYSGFPKGLKDAALEAALRPRVGKQPPMEMAADIVSHWVKDFPFQREDAALGELTRRIATALANHSK